MEYKLHSFKGLHYVMDFNSKKKICEDEMFITVLENCFQVVSSYVQIKEIPEVFFYDKKTSLEIKVELGIKEWVSAISSNGSIHIFYNFFKKNNQEDIIKHEMFHCGVYQCTEGKEIIPVWFNEALAYYIGRNLRFNYDILDKIKSMDTVNIKKMLMEDILLQECDIAYEIIKSLGNFLCNYFNSSVIKCSINQAATCKDFNAAFKKCSDLTVEELIDKWLDHVKI